MESKNKIRNMTKTIRAISVAAAAIFVKPNTPAMMAMIKNNRARINMAASYSGYKSIISLQKV
jgi:hypothetical protein